MLSRGRFMNRPCELRYNTARIYQNCRRSAVPLNGTAAGVNKRRSGAQGWWRKSLVAAELFDAHYQARPTLIGRGRRVASREDLERGASVLRAVGVVGQRTGHAPLM
jgi:hypothetical protein